MKTNLTVRDLLPAEVEPVRLFLGQHGWGHRTGSNDYFAQLIENSQRTAVALSGERRADHRFRPRPHRWFVQRLSVDGRGR
jgi:hypothetical protein